MRWTAAETLKDDEERGVDQWGTDGGSISSTVLCDGFFLVHIDYDRLFFTLYYTIFVDLSHVRTKSARRIADEVIGIRVLLPRALGIIPSLSQSPPPHLLNTSPITPYINLTPALVSTAAARTLITIFRSIIPKLNPIIMGVFEKKATIASFGGKLLKLSHQSPYPTRVSDSVTYAHGGAESCFIFRFIPYFLFPFSFC